MLAAIVLIVLAFAGLGIKMLFDRKAEFTGGSCRATSSSSALADKGISCGCGVESCESLKQENDEESWDEGSRQPGMGQGNRE